MLPREPCLFAAFGCQDDVAKTVPMHILDLLNGELRKGQLHVGKENIRKTLPPITESWWFQPTWLKNMIVKVRIFPEDRCENTKYLETTT